jgi:outer membrane murein-binding lipoprotein Lpp
MSRLSDPRRRCSAAGALLVGLVVALPAARGADPEVEALRQRVDELSRSVEELRDQVHMLQGHVGAGASVAVPATAAGAATAGNRAEQAPSAAATPAVIAGANAEIATLKKAWKQVKAGVPAERVKELLGPPTQELTINSKLAWYYIYPGIGAGSVFFSDSHRVSSTQTPPLGW